MRKQRELKSCVTVQNACHENQRFHSSEFGKSNLREERNDPLCVLVSTG